MTPGTRESASSSPKPLTERMSEVVSFVTASGVVRMSAGERVAATVTPGSDCAESRGVVGRCAVAVDPRIVGSSRTPMGNIRIRGAAGVGGTVQSNDGGLAGRYAVAALMTESR